MKALSSSVLTLDQMPDLHGSTHAEEQSTVLQLRLQQRRTREQLADQGIMPPLKSPAAFHEQRKSLERSKTGDYLKHKIKSRPEKSELVNMRILQEPSSDGPASDSHTKLKRARLNDSLNEKIAARPGAMELVQKNILPITDPNGTVDDGKDSYAFEEESSSESLSPDHSEENKSGGSRSHTPNHTDTHGCQSTDGSSQNQEENMTNSQETPQIPVPAIVKSKMSEKNRHKKPKDVKPKVKKLKYHQYIPPDQKAERSPPPQMDSAYARLLQQQQLFLQLQILSQQKTQTQTQTQTSFSFQTLSQHTHKQSSDPQSSCPSAVTTNSSSPVKNSYCNPSISPVRLGPLPLNLDDLKVSELRQHLRLRGLPVSGTKTALIERLRPFRSSSAASPCGSADASTSAFPMTPAGSMSSYASPHTFYPFCSSTPPTSPCSSELSATGSLPDSFSDVTLASPQLGPLPSPDAEKDKMLVEKQKVIEELTWKLHQEQRQVEELRLQLHKRKRLQDTPHTHLQPHANTHLQSHTHLQPHTHPQQMYSVSVKQEQGSSSCVSHCLELPFLSPQVSPQDSPAHGACSSPEPSPTHRCMRRDACAHACRAPRPAQIQQKSCSYPEQRNIQTLYSIPAENSISRGSAKAKGAGVQPKEAQCVSLRLVDPESPAAFCSSGCPASVSKRPPCYEDAVKQMVRSQQMDELLDVLIESGVSPSGGRFHRHMSPAMLPYDPATAHGDTHLEALLSPMNRTHPDAPNAEFHDKLMMDTPVSPTAGKIAAVATEMHGLGMTFPESPWETMEWLDLTPPSSATAFHNGLPPAGPSIFNTEFLDVGDISLNSAMDLHLDHW